MKTLTVIAVLLLSSVAVIFAQTNKFYVTEETHTNILFIPTTGQIEQAKHAKDSRPSEDDPEGNWGPISEGFQLSIRFSKDTFTNGEPIISSILLRNVSDSPLTYYVSYPKDDEMQFSVKSGQGQPSRKDGVKPSMTFIERLQHINIGSRSTPVLPVGIQRKFTVNLNDYFDLTTNEQYIVQVSRMVRKIDRIGETNVLSGNAQFRIITPLK